jgi:hypothetical protein
MTIAPILRGNPWLHPALPRKPDEAMHRTSHRRTQSNGKTASRHIGHMAKRRRATIASASARENLSVKRLDRSHRAAPDKRLAARQPKAISPAEPRLPPKALGAVGQAPGSRADRHRHEAGPARDPARPKEIVMTRNGSLDDVFAMLEGSLALLDVHGASLAAAHLSMVLDLMRKELVGGHAEGIAGIPPLVQSAQIH